MAIYTVHEPPARMKASRRGADRFRFVRDGFYFWAFVVPVLWLLWHRLWLVLIGYLILAGGLAFGLTALGVSGGPFILATLLLNLLVGLEASSLWRWTLRRNKWRDLGVVAGDTREAVEHRFFSTWSDDLAHTSDAAASTVFPRTGRHAVPSQTDVVGLFPEPSAR